MCWACLKKQTVTLGGVDTHTEIVGYCTGYDPPLYAHMPLPVLRSHTPGRRPRTPGLKTENTGVESFDVGVGAHELAQASSEGLSRSVWAKGGIQPKTGNFSHSTFPSTRFLTPPLVPRGNCRLKFGHMLISNGCCSSPEVRRGGLEGAHPPRPGADQRAG